ncbi:head-tail adaptor protein [Paracoccus sp. (in: a-proteobacteria)]|uniref:head-tail adaptor protein n=1 Tax=Paracoccus sp. TaxID=267 RepID=UPI00396C9121
MAVPETNIRLALEISERSDDGMGGYRTAWRQLGWLWAAMEARSGREQGGGTGLVSVVQWRIMVRGSPVGDPRRPRSGQRFCLGARRFLIEAVAERDASGRFLDCFAREEEQA